MGVVNVPNTFSANTTISSSEVNANFSTIYNEFNGSIEAANLATGAVTTAKIADSNVTTAKIADGAITPDKILTGTGSTWAWQSWTPTWGNLTIGNAVVTGKYIRIGKTVFARLSVVIGSTSSVGTNAYFSLPVAEHSDYATTTDFYTTIGQSHCTDSSANSYYVGPVTIGVTSGAGAALVGVGQADSTYSYFRGTTANIPMTWASGDIITATISYEAA